MINKRIQALSVIFLASLTSILKTSISGFLKSFVIILFIEATSTGLYLLMSKKFNSGLVWGSL